MKFRCKMSDAFSIQHFYRILQTVSKLCDTTCIVRMTEDRMYMFTQPSVIGGGAYVLAEMNPELLFDEYSLVGYAPDADEIFIEVNPQVLLRGLKIPQQANAKYVKMKLTNRVGPCLCVESEMPSATMRSKFFTHDIPVNVVPRSAWKEVMPKNETASNIGHELSSLKLFKIVVDRMKILGEVYAAISANKDKLSIDVGGPTCDYEISSQFENLENSTENTVESEDLTEEEDEIAATNGKFSVQVDIRRLCSFLAAQQYSSNRITLSIRHSRYLSLLIGDDHKFSLRFVLPGHTSGD